MLVRYINGTFLQHYTHNVKTFATSLIFLGSIVIMFYQNSNVLFVTAICMVGIATSFGDQINQGFIKGFNPVTISGYSIGTGCGGVIGALYYLALLSFDIQTQWIYLLLFPFYILYYVIFWLLLLEKIRLT